eukprot:TCALIF_01237-PA protein Name:"Protein of unknown function" AED:0.11 eAED:0.11 QI:68/0.8/0.66/1/0.8/0.66/6/36/433
MKSVSILPVLYLGLVQANPNCMLQYEQLGRCYSTHLMQRTEHIPPISLCDFLTKALQCVDILRYCVSQEDLDNERDSLFGVMIHNPDVVKLDDPNRCRMVRNGKRMTFTSLCSFEEAKLPHQRTKKCMASVLEKFFRTHRHSVLGLSDSHQCDLLKDVSLVCCSAEDGLSWCLTVFKMSLKHNALILLVPFLVISLAKALPMCDEEMEKKLNHDFNICQAHAQSKLRNASLDICTYFDETVNYCGNIMAPCRTPEVLKQTKENSLRVVIGVLKVEKTFEFENCSIIQEYGIDIQSKDEGKIIDGQCNEVAFQEAYQKFFACKKESEDNMRALMTKLFEEKADQSERDTVVCNHFQHTLNDCFLEVKKCTTSRRNWLASRKAFIVSAKKTNKTKKLGLNLDKCDFKLTKHSQDPIDLAEDEAMDEVEVMDGDDD